MSTDNKKRYFQNLLSAGFAILTISMTVLPQSGGPYSIQKSVIGGGGDSSSGGQFSITGTIGQPVAGQPTTGQGYYLHAGFWNPNPLSPTAAPVSVTGRVTTSTGRGISNVLVTITDANGASRSTSTASFGYFRFDEIQLGTYVIGVQAKRFQFATPSQIVTVSDQLSDLAFVALP